MFVSCQDLRSTETRKKPGCMLMPEHRKNICGKGHKAGSRFNGAETSYSGNLHKLINLSWLGVDTWRR